MVTTKKSVKARTAKVKEDLKKGRKKEGPGRIYLSTGSTTLNCAITGDPDKGFMSGGYYFFVGDSDSGKTKVAERVEAPRYVDDEPVYSETAEDFYYHLDDAIADGRPFIYLLDSQDALSSKAEVKKFKQNKRKARGRSREEDEGKSDGSYGDGKAKVHSSNIRRVARALAKTQSILIVLNQTRDSFDMFVKSTNSGGRALKFYAQLQMWSSQSGKIRRTVLGKKRQLGVNCKVQVKKNRITGRDRTVVVPIYHSYGVDDIGACIEYLIDEKVWTQPKGSAKINGTIDGDEFTLTTDALAKMIEEKELVGALRKMVGIRWNEIEEASQLKRRKRY